jgi:AcrR family transcriptional regulator
LAAAVKTPRQSAAPVRGGGDRRWQRRKHARPAEILDAALELFVERGYSATRLEEVARRAGVTKGTMYLYFESKEVLFKAVVRGAVTPNLERAERQLEDFRGSYRALLEMLLRGWWQALEGSKASGLPKLVISEAANFPELARFFHDEVVGRGHRVLVEVLRRGIESGEFRPLDLDYTARALRSTMLMGLVWKHSMMRTEAFPTDMERYLNAAVELIVQGVVATPEGEMPYV